MGTATRAVGADDVVVGKDQKIVKYIRANQDKNQDKQKKISDGREKKKLWRIKKIIIKKINYKIIIKKKKI